MVSQQTFFPNIVWFEDEPGGSWWACKSPSESHWNERDPKFVQVWNCIVEDDLKELIGDTYTNKMHLLFGSLPLKNFTVKLA